MLPLIAATVFQAQTEVQSDWVKNDNEAKIGGQTLKYKTTTGLMPIRAANGDIEGRIFFCSYRRTDVPVGVKRPVTFVFNDGPGSASVWLHLGLVGPIRPKMGSLEGFLPAPPYELVDNGLSGIDR